MQLSLSFPSAEGLSQMQGTQGFFFLSDVENPFLLQLEQGFVCLKVVKIGPF